MKNRLEIEPEANPWSFFFSSFQTCGIVGGKLSIQWCLLKKNFLLLGIYLITQGTQIWKQNIFPFWKGIMQWILPEFLPWRTHTFSRKTSSRRVSEVRLYALSLPTTIIKKKKSCQPCKKKKEPELSFQSPFIKITNHFHIKIQSMRYSDKRH